MRSATSAYQYLFGPQFDAIRNPYDPQYRGVCDMYNEALESALRIMQEEGVLKPGGTATLQSAKTTWDVTVVRRSGHWEYKDFDEFKFVSDYQVNGFTNRNGTYGLGVPLIAVRKQSADDAAYQRYFPNKLSFPVTAFMRVLPENRPDANGGQRRQALLELYDPMVGADIMVGRTRAPLESDLTTPLAYLLNASKVDEFSTLGLLRPDKSEKLAGLIMTQPYEPDKIPVLFVHGLWSDPSAWAEMFNELLNDRAIRDNYQFWFYMYPTGQPFWISAAELRGSLQTMRSTLDPQRRNPNLDRMVLVGHSMGGLVSKLQVVEGGDAFWNAVSEKPFRTVKASEKVKAQLAGVFYFHPNTSVRRVVTIATPHRGSAFANPATQWLFGKLISLPQALVEGQTELFRDNPGLFRSNSLSRVRTSIDSLSPKSPLLPVLLTAERVDDVRIHNIVGQEYEDASGDGIVSLASAHLDDADSELLVRAKHTTIHSVPLTILEVRRILRDHLAESRRTFPNFRRDPRVYQTSDQQVIAPWHMDSEAANRAQPARVIP